MSESTRLLFSAIIAIVVICLLVVVFMVAADRTSDQRRFRSFRASFAFGLFLIVFSGILSGIALNADRHHGVIAPTYHSGWMSPEQGYAAAILLLLAGIYAIILGVRGTSRRDNATRNT
jgi:glycerol uptake facilitator-like aquaporin